MTGRPRLVKDRPFVSHSTLTGRWYFVASWHPSGPNGQHQRAHVKHDITDTIERILEDSRDVEAQQLREERDRYAAAIERVERMAAEDDAGAWDAHQALIRQVARDVDSGSAIAEVQAQAVEQAAQPFMDRLPDGTPNGRAYNSYTVARMLLDLAEQIRKRGQSE